MSIDNRLRQFPVPGARKVAYAGDVVTFTLDAPAELGERAWLRTNLGRGAVRRREILARVEQQAPVLHHDWHDLPMLPDGAGRFRLSIPLTEPGCFEAKSFLEQDNASDPIWPEGDNVRLKVEPAATVAANTIYNAFVRQHGAPATAEISNETRLGVAELDSRGYTVIPPSGTFRDVIGRLDVIMGAMGFRIIQLLPIFPTPTTYARMGRFGSPFAALDFMDVDPALAEFDRRTTPLDQFRELADAVHAREGRLILDIPINHTGWASRLQVHHPEWFKRNRDDTFRSPGAWGVTWEDLSELDYEFESLWEHMAEVFEFWLAQGADGFRCDAGYMIPYPVWRYLVARIRNAFPDAILLLEGLGGKWSVTRRLMGKAGLNWAYSELFQVYDRGALEHYLPRSTQASKEIGLLVHFAETHDNNRLAATTQAYSRMRTALAALCSTTGGFGITNGVEWFATEKVDVHGASSIAWGNDENQVDFIARLNTLLALHPAFQSGARIEVGGNRNGEVLMVRRVSGDGGSPVRVLINLDQESAQVVHWPSTDGMGGQVVDELSGRIVAVACEDGQCRVELGPAEVLCLGVGADPEQAEGGSRYAVRCRRQRLRQVALQLVAHLQPDRDFAQVDPDAIAKELGMAPLAFVSKLVSDGAGPFVRWEWPEDRHRTVMLPPGHGLFIKSPRAFRGLIREGGRVLEQLESVPDAYGSHFTFFFPRETPDAANELALEMVFLGEQESVRHQSSLLCLPEWERVEVATSSRPLPEGDDRYALCTNGRGAMSQVRAAWGSVLSQYDAFLAANLDDRVPVDRRILISRFRAWIVCRGYSHELAAHCTTRFDSDLDGHVRWTFRAPVGQGRTLPLVIDLELLAGRNAIRLHCTRVAATTESDLPDSAPVSLILRPDLEDRNFHETTRAFTGPEGLFPQSVHAGEQGFRFAPYESHELNMSFDNGQFVHEPEWHYMVEHPMEKGRGLAGHTDLFSPGYFRLELPQPGVATISAVARKQGAQTGGDTAAEADVDAQPMLEPDKGSLGPLLQRAMKAYLVKRDEGMTVIAGYPWFLDWGRDTLICLRGMIVAGYIDESTRILQQFGRFVQNGTLPNMIRGDDASNRDTSDAPLWFVVAVSDLLEQTGREAVLELDCGGRSLRDVVREIVQGYRSGTPNGIWMDEESGLIFSPTHFTWMDTDHPAGTPREGYPVEIQALWQAALQFLGRVDGDAQWTDLAARVRSSINSLYRCEGIGLSDCLHGAPGTTATQAVADDALRSNQLLAVTLGAIDDTELARKIVGACESLLVPGAIRSLASRPVRHELPVYRAGALLNTPSEPYWGHYVGDEDTRRKPAYHNGTAWTWPFPSYAEALHKVYGDSARETALALLGSSVVLLEKGCLGQIPEITDGDTPHTPRGCGAQAWGVTELYRVVKRLQG